MMSVRPTVRQVLFTKPERRPLHRLARIDYLAQSRPERSLDYGATLWR